MCELQLTVGIMSCTALLTTLCVKGGTHPIEGPPLEACHGKGLGAVAILLTRCELGKGHRSQTGIEVKIEFGL